MTYNLKQDDKLLTSATNTSITHTIIHTGGKRHRYNLYHIRTDRCMDCGQMYYKYGF